MPASLWAQFAARARHRAGALELRFIGYLELRAISLFGSARRGGMLEAAKQAYLVDRGR
jgi:hypothetical protein